MSADLWLALERFNTVMAAGLLVLLVVGLAVANWTAVGASSFGLVTSLAGIALARSTRRSL